MTYRVRITPTALADAEKFYLWIAQDSPVHAANWFNGLFGAIDVGMFKESPAQNELAVQSPYTWKGRHEYRDQIQFFIVSPDGGNTMYYGGGSILSNCLHISHHTIRQGRQHFQAQQFFFSGW